MVMTLAILVLTLGNQLWTKYVPKYLEYLGASILVIRLYGSLRRVVKALYQYPEGWVSDKLEPTHKALIVDLAERNHKGGSIGLYYLIREGIVIPAPLFGALL